MSEQASANVQASRFGAWLDHHGFSIVASLGRMLRNLKALYAEKEDWERALRCTDRILTLEPEAPAELRDRGLLYLRVGHYKAAREDLSKFLATKPPEKDAESVREVLIKTSAERARLN